MKDLEALVHEANGGEEEDKPAVIWALACGLLRSLLVYGLLAADVGCFVLWTGQRIAKVHLFPLVCMLFYF